ncbi:PREDICTED: structure-specific endonuclease subunit SLX4 isoform X1 [Drosophila arizonae]|uniref:Structure-specific endonuclease subunit SLX4 n=1 Tax=Drosophila arizonae TaxID=7263 RepID=A0ABM1P8R9_DROAR|nr:PREDICTED: structure-specific endonuclease subunit SLX4 isoform X1 [Drosophila arizonae]
MDRETRRANFQKLQTANSKQRSRKASSVPLTLSKYFDQAESSSNAAAAQSEEQEQLFAEPSRKKTRASRQDAPTAVPKPKKAPKLRSATTQKRARGGGRSKQPTISDFLRNEQLFSEVTAQHCMADNFSPDDIEMALALSKSEAEKHGRLRLQDTEDEREEVVNLIEDAANQSTDNIRRKLQKYGFRTAAKEEYNVLTFAAVPKRGKRCKWANKFTPLTLRDPEEQLKKLRAKVDALMKQQVRTKLPSPELQLPFELISKYLQRLQVKAEQRIIHEPSEEPLTNLPAYYVQDLMEVSRTPAHHLLKSWEAIPGRDLSPKRESAAGQRRRQQLEQVYKELEEHFGAAAEQRELDDLEKLVVDNMIHDTSQPAEQDETLKTEVIIEVEQEQSGVAEEQVHITLSAASPLKEPPDKRARMTPQVEELSNDKENRQPSCSSALLTLPTQSTRCTSPDLFADSDDEEEESAPGSAAIEMQNFSLKVYKNISTTDMNSYEVYSSDEVKTVKHVEAEPETVEENFVDLTQKSDSSDAAMESHSSKSLFEQHIFPPNPIIDFDDDVELSEQPEPCEISEELYAKYASQSRQPKADSTDHSLKINSPAASLAASDSTLSFSQLENTKLAFSLTQSSGQLEASFKSPLSRRSTSFIDNPISPFTTPLSHSNASIDLTQDSGDDDDNDKDDDDDGGVLLSDDEINYSIWKADKAADRQSSSESTDDDSPPSPPLKKTQSVPFFRTMDDLDAYLDGCIETSSKSRSPNKSALSKERAEFGIMDAAISQPITDSVQAPLDDWTDASFLDTPPESRIKPHSSSSTNKFKELLNEVAESADDFDEFDRLVFQKDDQDVSNDVPRGLDRLLLGEINTETLTEPAQSTEPATPAAPDQLEVNGQVYSVRVCQSPKPDFVLMTESELLQQLYKYGIKPLKRKQAVKLLEYIYNQTHPIMLPLEEEPQQVPLPRSKSTPLTGGKGGKSGHARLLQAASTDCLTPTDADFQPSLKFRDACGTELLRFSQTMPPALCDEFEYYILQTNVTKKTPQPLLPLHIAWHNLLCANPSLHESVLMYEPIDLQEIYLYFKQLGHRYEPKDLKSSFDRRCIIFRYELAPPSKQTQRHIRKPKSKKPSGKS